MKQSTLTPKLRLNVERSDLSFSDKMKNLLSTKNSTNFGKRNQLIQSQLMSLGGNFD